jgi:hypothetical protein
VTRLGLPDVESLSLEAQIAQLVVVRASGYVFDHQRRYPQWELDQASLRHCVETLGVGGVILLGGSAVEVGVRSQQLQSWADIPCCSPPILKKAWANALPALPTSPADGAIGDRRSRPLPKPATMPDKWAASPPRKRSPLA